LDFKVQQSTINIPNILPNFLGLAKFRANFLFCRLSKFHANFLFWRLSKFLANLLGGLGCRLQIWLKQQSLISKQ
jgi:hypothetical protein